MIHLEEPTRAWVEICPNYMGPGCNAECALRLRTVLATYDRSIPLADEYCPVQTSHCS